MSWIIPISRPSAAQHRLICFPYAGGGASIFQPWRDFLTDGIDLFALQPPGRERRFAEPPIADLRALVSASLDALAPLADRPLILFGHSLGAIVAFETARALQERGKPAALLMVSGRQAPDLPSRRRPIAHLADDAFIEELGRLNGTPKEVLETPELMALLMPMLRADFTIADTYRRQPGAPLSCPILALGSEDDEWIDEPGLDAWRHETNGDFDMRIFPGDHFYLNRYLDQLVPFLCGAALRH